MKEWKATFWMGTEYTTISIRRTSIHFVVLFLETYITENNWELVSLKEVS